MSNGTSYVIQSGLLADLVVSNDPSHPGNVVLRWLNGNDANQQWAIEPANNGFYLKNNATGTYLSATGANSPVTLNSHGDIWQDTGSYNQLNAIRLALNPSQNLNALGGHPVVGTQIGTWNWGGGAGNETWMIADVASVWPRPTAPFSYVSGMAPYLQLSVKPGDTTGPLVVDDNFASNNPTANFIFTATQWFSGFSIVNKASGLLAYVSGNGNGSLLLQRAANQLNADALWTYGNGGAFNAIRPWINSGQNWNVFGNPHPIPKGALQMGTWSWGGGQANEIWQTVTPNELRQAAPSELWQPEVEAPAEVWQAAAPGNGSGAGSITH